MKLKVIGSHNVAGVEPGGMVDTESDDMAEINVEALIEAGHLEANKPASKAKEQ